MAASLLPPATTGPPALGIGQNMGETLGALSADVTRSDARLPHGRSSRCNYRINYAKTFDKTGEVRRSSDTASRMPFSVHAEFACSVGPPTAAIWHETGLHRDL